MRGLVYTRPGSIELLELDPPKPGPADVLVAVKAVGVCGSELEGFASASPMRVPPLIMGHEFAGVVLDTGQPVAVNPIISCNVCDLCQAGAKNLCRKRVIIGISRPGGYAELVAVPRRNVYPLPGGMTPQQGAMVEPFANAVHAFARATDFSHAHPRIAVIGAGMMGLALLVVALRLGNAEVTIADVHVGRREQGRRLGAHQVTEDLDGEFDVAFDCVGLDITRRASIAHLKPGGLAVWIGLHDSDPGFDARELVRSGKHVLGTFAYQDGDFQDAMEFTRDLGPEWYDEYPFQDGAYVFTRLLVDRPVAPKTILLI
jgi:threonine dehydrogenase-like Zn-dependent dehydrogenase